MVRGFVITLMLIVIMLYFCNEMGDKIHGFQNRQSETIKLLKQQNAYLRLATKENRVVVYICGDKFDIMGIEGKDVFIVSKK